MCFSAPASFIAGTALSAIGIAALRNTRLEALKKFRRDKGIDYFKNTRRATYVQRQYAIR